jgi:hypothetical protein
MYFKAEHGGTNELDRVKLWIDNKLIIDQWTSISSLTPTGSYLFDSSTGIYDIHAEFLKEKSVVVRTPRLSSSFPLPSSRLCLTVTAPTMGYSTSNGSNVIPRRALPALGPHSGGGLDVMRKEARPFDRTTSGVRARRSSRT